MFDWLCLDLGIFELVMDGFGELSLESLGSLFFGVRLIFGVVEYFLGR